MANYNLLTYQSPKGPRAGINVGDQVFDVAAVTRKAAYATVLDVLNDWRAAQKLLSAAADKAAAGKLKGQKLSKVRLQTPVLYPSAIYCAGANYSDHVEEMARAQGSQPEPDPHTLGLKPWHFIKTSRAAVAPNSTVKLPSYSKMVDWEAELVAVIGRPAKDVPLEKALDYVAGYTVANDLSARDAMRREGMSKMSPFHYDWVGQKCFDGACPVGPWITPAKQIGNPGNLGIKLWVNDVLKQDSNTGKMIYNTAEQISHLSTRMTLQPGDLVLTGTPAGVGMGRREFLQPGDVVKAWIEKIGTLTNKIS